MNGFLRHGYDRFPGVCYGPLLPKAPSIPTPPTPPSAPQGTSQTSNNANANTMLAQQRAASLQGGTVMGNQGGNTTTKTLLGQ
jgi:hypothetical protein